jgi:hypothetical protein
MTGRRTLSPRTQRLLVIVAAVETVLKVMMLLDLRRRPSIDVRGSKRLWSLSTLIASAGLIPLAYFVVGRRRTI